MIPRKTSRHSAPGYALCSNAAEEARKTGEESTLKNTGSCIDNPGHFTQYPLVFWRKIRTNNPLENLNSQVKRRTRTVGIFPNRDSVIRLVGMVLLEQHEDWISGRRYMNQESLRSIDIKLPEETEVLIEIEEMVPECVGIHTPH